MAAEDIEILKKRLGLIDHPEGGAFRECWRGDRNVTFTEPTKHDGERAVGTSIYFLLAAPNFISWHQHRSDMIYCWHRGGKLRIHLLDNSGKLTSILLGDAITDSECVYQFFIPHDTWYAAEVVDAPYSLFSDIVMPGFEFKDWTEGKKVEMIQQFPEHKDLIGRLSKH